MFETLGHYKVLDSLGAGALGEMYRARDTRLGRTVAIKVIAPAVAGDPARRERFLRDAGAAARLSHPNIAALYEIGDDQGALFLVCEFVPGDTLKTTIAGRPLNPRRAIDLAIQIADALADAHAEDVVHRDLKPDNIIVTPKGNAKILDFGLAAWTTGGGEPANAAPGPPAANRAAAGTGPYVSPEQALGEQIDSRSDVFSLGAVLFEMLTGRPPFSGATPDALALQILQASAPAPSAVNPGLPRELDPIVSKALAKSLDQRFESAATMAAELRVVTAILDVRSGAAEPATAPAVMVPARRSYAGWLALLALLAALAAVGWWQRSSLQRLWRRTMGPAPAPVIAVMPLEPAASDPSQMFFADGLTEDLMARLGQTPGLEVIGRSAARSQRGRAPREVAGELGAAVVLSGRVGAFAESVTISLELLDPTDPNPIWSNEYTRAIRDIFAVQAEVARDVAAALRVPVQPTASIARASARVVDRQAYEMYLRGRDAIALGRPGDAIGFFEEAVAADAGLGEAFAGLADALHADGVEAGVADDPARSERVRAAADRAYQQDPDLAQANLAMGFAAGSLGQALGHMRRAIELDPSYGAAYHAIGDQIRDFDPERAIAFYRRSLIVDPYLEMNRVDIAIAWLLLNRSADARREAAALRADRLPKRSRSVIATIDLDERHYEEALAKLASLPYIRDLPSSWTRYVVSLRSAGKLGEALTEATALTGRFRDFCEGRALLAGLMLEQGQAAEARRLAEPLLTQAAGNDERGSALRCAATAAAALGDAVQTAKILERITTREEWLRSWSLAVGGQSGGLALRGRAYPWMKVVDLPPVVTARENMAGAYARAREVAATKLAGVLPQQG